MFFWSLLVGYRLVRRLREGLNERGLESFHIPKCPNTLISGYLVGMQKDAQAPAIWTEIFACPVLGAFSDMQRTPLPPTPVFRCFAALRGFFARVLVVGGTFYVCIKVAGSCEEPWVNHTAAC